MLIYVEPTDNFGSFGVIDKHVEDAEIFEKSGNVYYQNLGFIYEGNKLIDISEDIPFNENSKG